MTKQEIDSAFIDLHTHTQASDGALSPTELVELAIANKTKMLAITDHDTIAGYEAARDFIQNDSLDIRLITGVEISTVWEGMGIHLVGLDFNPHHEAIVSLLKNQAKARQERAENILQKLQKIGFPMTIEELQSHAKTTHIGRPHIARLMLDKGYVSSIDKAFKKYLGAGKMGDVKSGWVDLVEATEAICHSGGVAVIAHPNHYKMTRSKLLRMIDDFIGAGGQGIEVISGKQHQDITRKLVQIAVDKGLCASLGSDFHRQLPYAATVGVLPRLPAHVVPVWTCFHR